MKSLSSYRPEIDGLRAVSVMGVVLYHAGLGFPGGFVGVDVFFVISGFLITGIILRGLDTGEFSLVEFWTRRIRRIVPAAAVMVVIVLLLGTWMLHSKGLVDLSKSALAQSLMLSNVYFWKDTGYFTTAAEYKPLLHTWTLALEEQFYLVLPFTLVLLHRTLRRHVRTSLILATVGSLALCICITPKHRGASFYLLPPRAWELLAGGVLAAYQSRIVLNKGVSEALSLIGLSMILGAMLGFDASIAFPGAWAMLPVAGAVGFIAGNSSHRTLAGRLLSTKPAVFLGLISYSLYLWHWPMFSFAGYLLIEMDLATAITLICLSILAATLSWKFVETPFRTGPLLRSPSRAFGFGLGTLGAIGAFSLWIVLRPGFPERFSPVIQVLDQDMMKIGMEFQSKGTRPVPIGAPADGATPVTPDFVVWGDSHGMVYSQQIDLHAKRFGLVGEAFLTNAKIPIPGLRTPFEAQALQDAGLQRSASIIESIIERRIPHVILISRWAVWCSGESGLEIAAGRLPYESLVTDMPAIAAADNTAELAAGSVRRQLARMLDLLEPVGTTVWIIRQVPETTSMRPAYHLFLSRRLSFVEPPDLFTVTLAEHLERQRFVDLAFDLTPAYRLRILDPARALFDNPEGRLQVYAERSYYKDDDHLTAFGAERLMGELLGGVLEEISRDRGQQD